MGVYGEVSAMSGAENFSAVLGKTAQQLVEDINEFVTQFKAAKRNNQNAIDPGASDDSQPQDSERDARQAAAACLAVLSEVSKNARSAFDAANLEDCPQGRVIEQAEQALRRIVQTEAVNYTQGCSKKFLATAEASGIIIRCRKYWQANTDQPLDLGTKASRKPYGEFLDFVAEQFEVEPAALFDRELEIRQRERVLQERMQSQRSQASETTDN